jgi:GH25 family lysozyme M1 (1,4-beta-N-acetylmuramidase)
VAEARYFVTVVKLNDGIGRSLLFLDYEDDAVTQHGGEWVRSFIREVKRLTGVNCGVYTNTKLSNAQGIDDICIEEGVLYWHANYWHGYTPIEGYRQDIKPQLACDIYQYTSSGYLPGYEKALDLNVFYGNEITWDTNCQPS